MTLEQHFAQVVASIRARLASADQSRMEFELRAEGRVDGELKLEVTLGEYSAEVAGDTIEAVVEEYLRRKGWTKIHAPLALPDYSAEQDK